MKLPLSYKAQEKLKSLSERFSYLTHNPHFTSAGYVDKRIKSENLQYNLSLIISHIIIKLNIPNKSVGVFKKIITEYNESEGKNLTLEDFEKVGWIRIIYGEVVIPQSINSLFWRIDNSSKKGESINIPIEKTDLVNCLRIYYKANLEGERFIISKSDLDFIINRYSPKNVTIAMLEERGIIAIDKKNNSYYWQVKNDYAKSLNHEIASTLWLLIGGENATSKEFSIYANLIRVTEIWIDSFESYLDRQNIDKIAELAENYLYFEVDLLNSDQEFKKIYLDTFSHNSNFEDTIPNIEINNNNTFEFIKNIKTQNVRFQEFFGHQNAREFYYLILRIIINSNSKKLQIFQKFIKDITRPFIVWTLYEDIPRFFPFAIPYLLDDTELIPVAFSLIDEIRINTGLLIEQADSRKRDEERLDLLNQLWLELFDFILELFSSVHSEDQLKGEAIAEVLIPLVQKVFKPNAGNQHYIISHNALKRRYDEALKILSNKRIQQSNIYLNPTISPKIISSILPSLSDYIKLELGLTFQSQIRFINLNSSILHLSIEVLRLLNSRFEEGELNEKNKQLLIKAKTDLVFSLKDHITEFHFQNEINTSGNEENINKRKYRTNLTGFGIEIIDWGYLFSHFAKLNLLDAFHSNFIKNINFDIMTNKYSEQNKEQSEKIRLYLKAMIVGFISIGQKKTIYETEDLPASNTLIQIEKWIKELSLQYSLDDLSNKRVDVFKEINTGFGYDIYFQRLTILLYKSINYFTIENSNDFIIEFFASSNDIGRMLAAINILDSKEQQNIISQRISSVNLDIFLEEVFTTTELQYVSIEAANSENHWELAKPMIERIQNHYKRVNHPDENRDLILFEINLLLAFKERDFNKLNSIEITQKQYIDKETFKKKDKIKQYYTALFILYNDKNYEEAIKLFKSLLSKDTKNTNLAYHLYRAETLKAISVMNTEFLIEANQNWENFINFLSDNEKIGLSELSELVAINSLHYLAATKNTRAFDQTINRLSKKSIYELEIIPTVYNFYIGRNLHELAYDYIQDANEFLLQNRMEITSNIKDLFSNSGNDHLFNKFKISLERIRNLHPSKIPNISPDIINGKKNLSDFILNEIIQCLKIVQEKKEALRQITHENRFNDFLQAILRFRFPFWGWTITDQSRLGTSSGGADAGNADLVIQSGGGENFALIEAFILRDKNYTETHILKCPKYISNIKRYYILVYFLGESISLGGKWNQYKTDVTSITYPNNFAINPIVGITDLDKEFEDAVNIKIGKSIHGENIEMFHIMINIQTGPPPKQT